jgi:glycosyltransferase involved in cell wall biosynthesis
MAKFKKTLVVLTPGFPKDEADTSLPVQRSFVQTLNRYFPDLEVVVLAMQYPTGPSPYSWYDSQVFPLKGPGKTWAGRLRVFVRTWKKLSLLRRQRHLLGLFSIQYGYAALIGIIFSRRYSLKHFIWITGQDARKDNRLAKWFRPAGNELIAMSGFLSNEFFKNHAVRPGHLITNGLPDMTHLANHSERSIDIIGAGSLVDEKKFDLFIAVIARLKEQLPSLKAVICGEGPALPSLKQLVRDSHLELNVSFAGHLTQGEVYEFFGKSRILLDTSAYEGSSSVCLEALCAGAHVVSLSNPMSGWIRHWHVVDSEEEITSRTMALLLAPDTDYGRVEPFRMKDSVADIMKLFACPGPPLA